jgi:hypothetical protein
MITVGTATVTLTGGHSKTVAVALNSTGLSRLKSHHTLAVKVTVKTGGAVIASRNVTLKEPAQKPSKKKG